MLHRKTKQQLKIVKSLFSMLITFSIILLPASQAFAKIESDTLKFYSKNNILYYDPTGVLGCNPSNFSIKPSGDKITWIGDSYTKGAQDIITKAIPGTDIHAQTSKHFGLDVTGNPSGLAILKQLKNENKIRDYVVLALGTNDIDGINQSPKYLNEAIQIIGKDRKIILVTPRTKTSNYEIVIKEIKEAQKQNSNIVIADWNQDGYDEKYYETDNIHPSSNNGYEAWFKLIYNAIPGGSGKVLSGTNAEEIIWSFFINQGFNDYQVAGIIGNAGVESNLNPIANSGTSYWGLFQWGAVKSAGNAWQKLETILRNKGYGKYLDDTQYYSLYNNDSGKLIPIDDLRGILELEMQFAMENGAAHGTSWIEKVKKTTSIREATEAFLVEFEGAVGGSDTIKEYKGYIGKYYQGLEDKPSSGFVGRVTRAQQYYEKYAGSNGGFSSTCGSITGDAGDPLAYLQQYVTDVNAFYGQSNQVPTTYSINVPLGFKMNDSAVSGTSILTQFNTNKGKSIPSYTCFGATYCGQCTGLSGWFVHTLTSYNHGNGHGKEIVRNLVKENPGLSISTTPTPYSVFSKRSGEYGHTGVVLEVLDNGEIVTIENNMNGYYRSNGIWQSGYELEVHQFKPTSEYEFVDLSQGIDLSHLGETY